MAATVTTRYERNLAALACLAPAIQRAILNGAQPEDVTPTRLVTSDLPLSWEAQRRALGFS